MRCCCATSSVGRIALRSVPGQWSITNRALGSRRYDVSLHSTGGTGSVVRSTIRRSAATSVAMMSCSYVNTATPGGGATFNTHLRPSLSVIKYAALNHPSVASVRSSNVTSAPKASATIAAACSGPTGVFEMLPTTGSCSAGDDRQQRQLRLVALQALQPIAVLE